MPKRKLLKQSLPRQERLFWEKLRHLVVPELAGEVWFPSWWAGSEVPKGFKEFMLDRFASEMRNDEESLHAWSLAVRAVTRYLIDRKDIVMDIFYDYPSCDGFPYLLIGRDGKLLGLISINPVDYIGDGVYNWRELRQFLLQVANDVIQMLEEANHE